MTYENPLFMQQGHYIGFASACKPARPDQQRTVYESKVSLAGQMLSDVKAKTANARRRENADVFSGARVAAVHIIAAMVLPINSEVSLAYFANFLNRFSICSWVRMPS
jgi:hypothetical protein